MLRMNLEGLSLFVPSSPNEEEDLLVEHVDHEYALYGVTVDIAEYSHLESNTRTVLVNTDRNECRAHLEVTKRHAREHARLLPFHLCHQILNIDFNFEEIKGERKDIH